MFSKTCGYALRAVVYLAYKTPLKLSIKDISAELDMPEHFTGKILQSLSKQGIVSSNKGPNGGFYMTERQLNTPIYEVVKAIDGTREFESCVLGLNECNELSPCPMHDEYKPLRMSYYNMFKGKTILSLAEELNKPDITI